jgi:hypothetical protein
MNTKNQNKNKKPKNSFIFYRSFFEAIFEVKNEEKLQIYEAISNYALNKIEPNLKGTAKAIFILIKPQLDANNTRYENGNKGGRPKTKTKPKRNQNETKTKPNENENENENVNENKKEGGVKKMTEIWNEICVGFPKATLNSPPRNLKLKNLIGNKALKDKKNNPLFETMEDWRAFCGIVNKSAFLNGENKRKWRASIDWCLDNVNKICEGNYD